MTFTIKISTLFECSLERAFKTPMLCDVSRVHTGYGLMPRVTHCSDDEKWGQPGFSKKIYVAPSLAHKGGFASVDTVIERIENRYWKIEVGEFQAWMLGFERFNGEWETIELEPDKIQVNYTYALYTKNPLFYPFNWLFAHVFWKAYMKNVLENVRLLAYSEAPYRHA